jgi:hypothetical protein
MEDPLPFLTSRPTPLPHGAVFPEVAGAVSAMAAPACGGVWTL